MRNLPASPHRFRMHQGFSLVEVLCAIVILGIGLAGLASALSTALRSTRESELQTSAALVAAGVIETLRAEGFLIDGETTGECGSALPDYRWRQILTPTDLDGLHDVKVSIEHTETGQVLYELRTLLFEAPLDASGSDRLSNDRDLERKRNRPAP